MVVKTAYKVRLDDGMEVGPLDGEMLRSWFQQGMIHAKTKIRAQDSKRWVPLSDTFDISDWGPAGGSSSAADRARAEEELEELEAAEGYAPQKWRTFFACALFLLAAAGAGYFVLYPDRWHPLLRPLTPWKEIALGFIAVGLLLVRGWDPMRKLVRVILFLATVALFPLAELLIFRGVSWRSLFVFIPAVVMGFGMFFFLSGRHMRWTRIVLSLLWVLAGAAGVVYLGHVPPYGIASMEDANVAPPPFVRPSAPPITYARVGPELSPAPMAGASPVAPGAVSAASAPPAPAPVAPTAAPSVSADAPSAQAIMAEVPLLSPAAAEIVRGRAVYAIEDAFRRSYELAGNGVRALSPAESKDLGELMAVAYANIPTADRRRLEAYMTDVRNGQMSTPEQNRAMSALMRDAVMKMPEGQRARLQAVYEKAVAAAR
jgi:hypothetical protein